MKTILLLAIAQSLVAEMPLPDFSQNQKIGVQNTILCQVNDKAISVVDVKKKMDLLFHQNYPQLENSNQARYQFYETSWRRVLSDLIDNELILADAANKEIKLTDGEVREALEERFGPNVMQTLDNIGFSYDEAWKMIKDEMIVQRMSWWFIHSKAMSSVTPQDIRQAYKDYLLENPSYVEWKYRVISIRSDKDEKEAIEKVRQFFVESQQSPENLNADIQKLQTEGLSISVSNEFIAKDIELSELHKTALVSLEPGMYSEVVSQTKDKKITYRIFYLAEQNEHPAPTFEDLSPRLKSELTQTAVLKESQNYVSKLRKHYAPVEVAQNLHPFTIQ